MTMASYGVISASLKQRLDGGTYGIPQDNRYNVAQICSDVRITKMLQFQEVTEAKLL